MAATPASRIGVAGLAVMGQNLALNIAEKGFTVSLYNRTASKTDDTLARAKAEGLGARVCGFHDAAPFVATLQPPRAVIMMVQAGRGVDDTISTLAPHMQRGDILIDGGNSHFDDTERRARELGARGIAYLGMGVSSGDEGARHGPSLMPGGSAEAYEAVRGVLERIAAQTDDGPCVTFCGAGGAGHFAKMVHNGLEYADMQLIAEVHDALRTLAQLAPAEEAALFQTWNADGSDVASFLLEITARILRTPDDAPDAAPGAMLLDAVQDVTGSKGTGKWTVEAAADLGIAVPTITAGLEARYISTDKPVRVAVEQRARNAGAPPPKLTCAAMLMLGHAADDAAAARGALPQLLRALLYCSKAAVYAQGFALLRAKAAQRGWGHSPAELARIWRGGCIIRAAALADVRRAFAERPELPNLLLDDHVAADVAQRADAWRAAVAVTALSGVAMPAAASALAYYDAMRRGRGPAALSAAQRDLFGAHGYRRTDDDAQQLHHTQHWGRHADT